MKAGDALTIGSPVRIIEPNVCPARYLLTARLMRIGLIADTHDRLPVLQAALDHFRRLGIDTVLHAGDLVAPFAARLLAAFGGNMHVVYGNNDGERQGLKAVLPRIQDGPLFLNIAGRRILLHHYIDWCQPADVARADVIVTGHSHELRVDQRDGKLFINPGECCGWLSGRCTVATLDPRSATVETVEVSP